MTVLSIDQGTTSTKAFLLYPDGRFEKVGQLRHQQFHPGEGLVEHDAEELLGNVRKLIAEGVARCPDVQGIALANQGETVVAWDRDTGRPLARAIVWQDQRTQGRLAAMAEADRRTVTGITGLPLDAYFSGSKLAWLLENVPGVQAAAQSGRLGLATSDTFFLERLTGAYITDPTTASRTSLMDLRACVWSAAACRLFGVPGAALPEIVPTAGRLSALDIAGRRIPVVCSIVDQQAALFGHGCRRPGDLKITFGTGTFALALTGETPATGRDGLLPTVAWRIGDAPPLYALDGGDYTAAAAVEWAASIGLASKAEDFGFGDGPSALERGLVFVPALAGLAAPYWDRAAAGAFLGLRQSTTAADLRQAVLEGVALRAAELLEALSPDGTGPVSVDGGMTANAGFVQFLADVTGRPVTVNTQQELTGLGAAQLGYLGLGLAVPPPPPSCTSFEPGGRSVRVRAARALFAAAVAATRSFGAAVLGPGS
jgi:glycerol kinase